MSSVMFIFFLCLLTFVIYADTIKTRSGKEGRKEEGRTEGRKHGGKAKGKERRNKRNTGEEILVFCSFPFPSFNSGGALCSWLKYQFYFMGF